MKPTTVEIEDVCTVDETVSSNPAEVAELESIFTCYKLEIKFNLNLSPPCELSEEQKFFKARRRGDVKHDEAVVYWKNKLKVVVNYQSIFVSVFTLEDVCLRITHYCSCPSLLVREDGRLMMRVEKDDFGCQIDWIQGERSSLSATFCNNFPDANRTSVRGLLHKLRSGKLWVIERNWAGEIERLSH